MADKRGKTEDYCQSKSNINFDLVT